MIITITAIALQPIEIEISENGLIIIKEKVYRDRFLQTIREMCNNFQIRNIYIRGTESYIQKLSKDMSILLPDEYKIYVLSDPDNKLQNDLLKEEMERKQEIKTKYYLF